MGSSPRLTRSCLGSTLLSMLRRRSSSPCRRSLRLCATPSFRSSTQQLVASLALTCQVASQVVMELLLPLRAVLDPPSRRSINYCTKGSRKPEYMYISHIRDLNFCELAMKVLV